MSIELSLVSGYGVGQSATSESAIYQLCDFGKLPKIYSVCILERIRRGKIDKPGELVKTGQK